MAARRALVLLALCAACPGPFAAVLTVEVAGPAGVSARAIDLVLGQDGGAPRELHFERADGRAFPLDPPRALQVTFRDGHVGSTFVQATVVEDAPTRRLARGCASTVLTAGRAASVRVTLAFGAAPGCPVGPRDAAAADGPRDGGPRDAPGDGPRRDASGRDASADGAQRDAGTSDAGRSDGGAPDAARSDGPAVDGGSGPLGPDEWRATASANAPAPRYLHGAVWTGRVMVVFGGFSTDLLGDGGRYDPVADRWLGMSNLGAPSPRTEPVMVWTGSEVVVWGGSLRGDGARYDPVADTWRAMDQNTAPQARQAHAGAWTGSEVMIWGGVGVGQPALGEGSRYDPVADRWRPTSGVGAPSPRVGHSMTSTGSIVVLWGGRSGATILPDGARYNPATDVWTALPATSAPTPRAGHRASWTGSEVLIVGGSSGASMLSGGGRYDVASNVWRPVATSDAPPSGTVELVWTGTEAIAWNASRAAGARYAPGLDVWGAMSALNAPSERTSSLGVWCGNVLVVWGGRTTQPENSGARYMPRDGL